MLWRVGVLAVIVFPQYGLLLDLDASLEDPPYPDSISVSDFITRAERDFRDLTPIILEALD
jgi:hypothetical protein